MNLIDRLAALFGYVPRGAVIQSSIAFKGEDRAHVVLLINGYQLIGEVECFKTRPPTLDKHFLRRQRAEDHIRRSSQKPEKLAEPDFSFNRAFVAFADDIFGRNRATLVPSDNV